MVDQASWGADCPISMPGSLPDPTDVVRIPMGGFCFTRGGLAHDMTAVDLETFKRPTYAPPPAYDPYDEVVFGDLHGEQ